MWMRLGIRASRVLLRRLTTDTSVSISKLCRPGYMHVSDNICTL